jgi:hypothetical protein
MYPSYAFAVTYHIDTIAPGNRNAKRAVVLCAVTEPDINVAVSNLLADNHDVPLDAVRIVRSVPLNPGAIARQA